MMIRKHTRRCCLLWLTLPAWLLLLSAVNGADPPPKAKEAPGKAEERRWEEESEARIARLSPEQRRRVDAALEQLDRGRSYSRRTDYARAELLYRQATETFKELLGDEDFNYVASLSNLALLYQDTGDYPQAVRVFQQIVEACSKHVGEKHYLYAMMLDNLGDALKDMGDLQQAEAKLKQSLEIFGRMIGEDLKSDPELAARIFTRYGNNLNNLAALYRRKGDYAQAEKYQLQDLNFLTQAILTAELGSVFLPVLQRHVRDAITGTDQSLSRTYAVALGNLALIYLERGDFPKAEETLLRSQALKEKLGYQDWPEPGVSVSNLGALYYAKKDYAQAEKYRRQALRITRRHFENTVIAQSERRQLNLARSLRSRLDRYLSCALTAHFPPEQVYEEMLAFKGSVFARQYWLRLMRHRAGNDAEKDRLYHQLQETARQMTEATFAQPDPEKAAARKERIQQLSDRKDQLEAELSRSSATFGDEQAILRQTPANLRAALPSGAALIDFLEFQYTPPGARSDKSAKAEWRMLVVVVRPDRPLEWRDLGSAQAIARACDNWRKVLAAEEEAGAVPDSSTAAAEVRRLIWQPLEALLEDCRALLVSPDGALASVPFAALPGSQPDRYLLEERAVAVLPVPQLAPQILRNGASSIGEGKGSLARASGSDASLLLLGDVDFGASSEQLALKPEPASSPIRAARGSRSLNFPPLPGTAREIEAIRASFTKTFPDGKTSALRRAEATKQAFLNGASGKRYLHLATHGFFARPELQSGLSRPLFAEGAGRRPIGYHPGVLSGLALAGAGSREADTSEGGDNGILTALEVADLDLSAADLVVLSACETGLGGSAGGEGLLGLQRAFQISGAGSVLASLWRVDDEATRQLMARFYANLWQEHLPPVEALRKAQLSILSQPPEPTKERGPGAIRPIPENVTSGRTHPRFWAAWILSGDPGDLSQLPATSISTGELVSDSLPLDSSVEQKKPVWPYAVGGGLIGGVVLFLAATRGRRQQARPD